MVQVYVCILTLNIVLTTNGSHPCIAAVTAAENSAVSGAAAPAPCEGCLSTSIIIISKRWTSVRFDTDLDQLVLFLFISLI